MAYRRFAGIVRLLSLIFSGVFAGFVVAVLVIELSVRRFGGSVYTQVRQVELAWLDVLASLTLIPAIIATVIVTLLAVKRRGAPLALPATAVVLLVVVLVVTLAVNLPINADQHEWLVQAPPADWGSVRDRWQIAHAVRTGAALLAFGCLSVQVFVYPWRNRAPGRPDVVRA